MKHNIHKIPLAHFVGNRFNICFMMLQVYITCGGFIESIHGLQANQLLQSVLRDLKTPTLITGCRALGLIDKIVTGPLWRKLASKSMSVLQMGTIYCEIKEKFDLWSEDASSLIDGSAICTSKLKILQIIMWNIGMA